MVKINDAAYGGFVLSKNVYKKGRPIRYTYREESSIPELNGWTIYSCDDSDKYVNNSKNFVIVSATTIRKYAPVMLEIYDAPYGTDLCWLYEGNKHVGFYDLGQNRDTTIYEIIKRSRFTDFYEFVGIAGEEQIEKKPEFVAAYGGRTFLNGMYRIHDNKDVEKWKEANACDISHDQCVGYKVPLSSSGKEIENMEVTDMEAYWERLTPLMNKW